MKMLNEDDCTNAIRPTEVRNEERCLIEVEVIPNNGISLCGMHVQFGEPKKVLIYKSDLPAIEEMVRSEVVKSQFARAKEDWEFGIKKQLQTAYKKAGQSIEDLTPKEYKEAFDAIDKKNDSPLTLVSPMFRENPGVLSSMKVLGAVPAPITEATRQANSTKDLVAMIAEAIRATQQTNTVSKNK